MDHRGSGMKRKRFEDYNDDEVELPVEKKRKEEEAVEDEDYDIDYDLDLKLDTETINKIVEQAPEVVLSRSSLFIP